MEQVVRTLGYEIPVSLPRKETTFTMYLYTHPLGLGATWGIQYRPVQRKDRVILQLQRQSYGDHQSRVTTQQAVRMIICGVPVSLTWKDPIEQATRTIKYSVPWKDIELKLHLYIHPLGLVTTWDM